MPIQLEPQIIRIGLVLGLSRGKGAEDAISTALRAWAARRNKEEVDLAASRARVRDHRRGLQVPTAVEEAAANPVAGQTWKGQRPGAGSPGWSVLPWRRVVFPAPLAMVFNIYPLPLPPVTQPAKKLSRRFSQCARKT